ncbi:MAG: DUF951 domain-containing protein [Clostridium sp.]|nr:DUF951 domain-containing protein [Clostridium sp.]MCM1547025.1 DUF951 domain-containing protein [Ruminococcus sp.]
MDVRPNDILVMKKKHPCGSREMFVIRSGMDFKLRCMGCSREFMIPRNKIEKNIKKIKREKIEEGDSKNDR